MFAANMCQTKIMPVQYGIHYVCLTLCPSRSKEIRANCFAKKKKNSWPSNSTVIAYYWLLFSLSLHISLSLSLSPSPSLLLLAHPSLFRYGFTTCIIPAQGQSSGLTGYSLDLTQVTLHPIRYQKRWLKHGQRTPSLLSVCRRFKDRVDGQWYSRVLLRVTRCDGGVSRSLSIKWKWQRQGSFASSASKWELMVKTW